MSNPSHINVCNKLDNEKVSFTYLFDNSFDLMENDAWNENKKTEKLNEIPFKQKEWNE